MDSKFVKVSCAFIISSLNIFFITSLEPAIKSAGKEVNILFIIAGVAPGSLLLERFFDRKEKRLKIHALLWGMFMSIAYVSGCRMRRDKTLFSGIGQLPNLIGEIICLTMLAASCLAPVIHGDFIFRGRENINSYDAPQFSKWRIGAIFTVGILLCWIPVFLAYFPSVFTYDAPGQLTQILTHNHSTHHPLIHTLFMSLFFRSDSKEACLLGMAAYSIVQMTIMATIFGYALASLYQRRVSIWGQMLLFIFYATFPTNSILSITVTKDVLFSGLVLLYTIIVCRMLDDHKPLKGRDYGLYTVCTVLMLLFRNNAVYAFVPSLFVMFAGMYMMQDKRQALLKKFFISVMGALVLYGVGYNLLREVSNAGNGSPKEMLSIPLQQMARVRVEAEETLDLDMKLELEQYITLEVAESYRPHLADEVKSLAVFRDNNPVQFIKTWLKLGIEYPQLYVDAFLDNSIGYWFLEDRTHAQIYGVGEGAGYLLTYTKGMPAGLGDLELSVIPGLRRVMEKVVSDNLYQKIPVIRVIFAPAFYWWLLCICIAIILYRKKYGLLFPLVFLLFYYITLLLSPTALIRYMYPFVVTVPVICGYISKELKV